MMYLQTSNYVNSRFKIFINDACKKCLELVTIRGMHKNEAGFALIKGRNVFKMCTAHYT
jgi:hypothetical protein